MKKLISKLHLILGLVSGLIVFIVSITGCIYTFEHEIQELTQPYRFVKEVKGKVLPPSIIKEIAYKATDGMDVQRIYYETPENASMALHYADDAPYFYLTFIDQYTGEVLKIKNLRTDFFTVILYLHISLLLPNGELIVGIATLVFFIMLVSGIVLWWPKNKKKNAVKQKFKIKWNGRWRRKNYDLHSVLGFYAAWVLLFTIITGLIWSFEWFENSLYFIASGGDTPQKTTYVSEVSSNNLTNSSLPAIDRAWYKVLEDDTTILGTTIYIPQKETDPIKIYSSPDYGTYGKLDWRYFDQYSLKELSDKNDFSGRYQNATTAQKIFRLNYDIHTGAILGITGKFIMFFISLISASLPITGFLLWLGRKKKKKGTLTKDRSLELV
ncbi:PepSY-associated TM helix domain-containing protein [Flammeovirga kamogawensis]|uniref:PepSY domain-containing protein n=1 Tax=Flammeovirga kamogawensis TaxID=373891 RepID=A0ABX8H1T2_9BACT|nr:PepSY-associated TM helix domain-containing protein [Flammeovirga kamogawensis]MBB6463634.1 putative iron-regulated membrane protein [Flammeovirga kamogawensis]QWG09856.1 PepSY domain-containing protein [Flammeovirga kamogawensis]TRX65363.1 PepSY domain-containing protein [Flammeovirga kamogawensis]